MIKHLPYCYYLIDLIIARSVSQHDNINGYVNLTTYQLDKVIPKQTRIQVISLLTYLNVINKNDSYSVGKFSMSYRIHPNHIGDGYKVISISTSIKSINNILNIKEETTSTTIPPYVVSFSKKGQKIGTKRQKLKEDKTSNLLAFPEYKFQRDQLVNIRFDSKCAEAYAKHQYLKKEFDDIPKRNLKRYHEVLAQLKKIEIGEIDLNLNNSVNRLFSCVANLRKSYRQFISDREGYSMFEIDFKSSHINHLLHLINQDIDNGNFVSTSYAELVKETELIRSFIVEGATTSYNDIYEYIAKRYCRDKGVEIDRCKAKEMTLERLINGKYPNQHLTKWINGLFPLIAEYIAYNDSDRRGEMATRLMISESKLIHNCIMKRVALLEHCTAYAVHDSIIVDSDNFDTVANIMREESIKYFGFEPRFSAKDLDTLPIEFHEEYHRDSFAKIFDEIVGTPVPDEEYFELPV